MTSHHAPRRNRVGNRAMAAYLRMVGHWLRRPRVVLACIGAVWLAAAAILPRLQFDMSFRPLFSTDPALNAATREFEAAFSQSSGAYLAAILESPDVLQDGFLDHLKQMSEQVSDLPHVTEVLSLASFMMPRADEHGARIVEVPSLLRLRASMFPRAGALGEALAGIDEIRGVLLSADGRRTLVLARVELPLSDLAGRRPVMAAFETAVRAHLPEAASVHFSGVSFVEDAYARLVLRNMLLGVGLALVVIALALYVFLGDLRAVATALAAVSVATPVTLALMALAGSHMTIVNSMVATLVLIIGVADAIHMQQAHGEQLDRGRTGQAAVLGMMEHTALPCLMTFAATAIGFLSLRTADLPAVREFGACVAMGVAAVFVLNQLLVPVLCLLWPPARRTGLPLLERGCRRWMASAATVVARHPRILLAGLAGLVAVSIAMLPRLEVVQRFNEELAADHPVRAAQWMLEEDFGGFLGPELVVRRRDGGSMLATDDAQRLRALQHTVEHLPGVLSVRGPASYAIEGVDAATLLQWRADSPLSGQLRDVISADGRGVALVVRIGDIGTRAARDVHDQLLATTRQQLGPGYEATIAGQWWLAQRGMMNILRDMTSSLLTSGIFILPLLLLVLRSPPLIIASLVPNVLPVLIALAYMAATGITLRIGTAMVLAGTIGIAFDDTVHFILRLHRERLAGLPPLQASQAAIRGTGKAVLLTTLVLVGGFLSMLGNDLRAIQDMGQVAAVAFAAGFVADLYLAPAVYLALAGSPLRTVVPVGS